MEKVSKDVFLKLAFELDLPSLLSMCESSKILNVKFCQKDELWLGRLKIDFPYRQTNFNLGTPKETYLYLYQILNKIRRTQGEGHPFSKGVFIRKPLLDFLTNADFGTLEDGTKISEVISDVLKLGLMSRALLTLLLQHYVKKNIVRNDGGLLHADPLMELYLGSYLDDLERKDYKNPRNLGRGRGRAISSFDRNNFKFSDIQRILQYGIVTKEELTPEQIAFLADGRTSAFLENIANHIRPTRED